MAGGRGEKRDYINKFHSYFFLYHYHAKIKSSSSSQTCTENQFLKIQTFHAIVGKSLAELIPDDKEYRLWVCQFLQQEGYHN